jgi:hypothetical protein
MHGGLGPNGFTEETEEVLGDLVPPEEIYLLKIAGTAGSLVLLLHVILPLWDAVLTRWG